MDRLIVDGFGKIIGRKSETIIIKEKGKTLEVISPQDLRQVIISGKGSISFDAIRLLAKHGVDILFLSTQGDVEAWLSYPEMRTVNTRRMQYSCYETPKSGHIAKQIVTAKLTNQAALLGTWAKNRKLSDPLNARKLLEARAQVKVLAEQIKNLPDAPIDEIRSRLMGIEGSASMFYWNAIAGMLENIVTFPGRRGIHPGSPRNAIDLVNALLNYGYGALYGEVKRGVHMAGLDPYGGFLHVDRSGRASLILDLMEEFRQPFIDRLVVRLLVKQQVKPPGGQMVKGRFQMNNETLTTIRKELHVLFEGTMSYRNKKYHRSQIIISQARQLAAYLRGEKNTYQPFIQKW